MTQETFHVIKDPVHDTMQFTHIEDAWIKPFIDSPNFQRLRHIKQLGMGDYIFPGAVHTRFNHCIGCCYVASQISNKIGLGEEERQLVIIACLLHDIGHGPFSHAFEDIFKDKLIRHEDWTPFFLADYRTPDFFQKYNSINHRHHLTEEKFKLIEQMIMHTSLKKITADIVSSQLDADRLDYLLRDSHFCGVSYGKFDFRWMLHCLTIIQTSEGERLGLTHKGIGVVEHYLMARRLMMKNIYHHQKKLALEFFLVQLLTHLAKDLGTNPLFANLKSTRLGTFLIAANHFNASVTTTNNTDALKQSFLKNNFIIYKDLCDYDIFQCITELASIDNVHAACEIARRIQTRELPKIVRINEDNLASVKYKLNTFKETNVSENDAWKINLIHVPHQSYTSNADPILVLNEHDEVRPLSELSLMIEAMNSKFEQTVFLCIDQAYYTPELIQAILN